MDLVEAAADRLALYEIPTMTKEAGDLARCLVSSAEHVLGAVSSIRDLGKPNGILQHCIEIDRLENVADRILRGALARLFREEKDPIARHQVERDLRDARVGDRPLRGRRQHHRGRRPREQLSARPMVDDRRDRRGRAGLRLHQRLPRRRELDRHRRVDARADAARGGGLGRVLQLHRVRVFPLHVAHTIGKGIVDPKIIDDAVLFGALGGAIAWNLITWCYGLPSSSSHALVGGLIGAASARAGSAVIQSGVAKTACSSSSRRCSGCCSAAA